METLNINYLQNHSEDFVQLSPFFIFDDVFEFQGYKFRNVYIFFEALKISELDKRQEFLDFYLNKENIQKLFVIKNNKLSYTTKFNKKQIDSLIFNNTEILVPSLEMKNIFHNLYSVIALKNSAFKYALLTTKSLDISFPELDENTSLLYISSSLLVSILKTI